MPPNNESTFSHLFEDAFSSIREIIRSEVRLAKTETKEQIGKAGMAGASLGGGIILALYAFGLALLAGVSALVIVVPAWLAFLIMAALVGIPAAVMIGAGRRRLRRIDLRPQRTIATVKENLQWARQQTE
jgi:putative superfamily III holin-X